MTISGFEAGKKVTEPQKLFGWTEKDGPFTRAMIMIQSGVSFEIRAERRAGKTSMVKCLMAECLTRRHQSPQATPLPVYVSLYQKSPKGTEAGYRCIMLDIVEALAKAKEGGETWIDDSLSLGYRDVPLRDPLTVLEKMTVDRLQHALTDVEALLRKNRQSMLLFFDEYERMADVFHDNPNNFFASFRECQQNYDHAGGGIFCVLAGAESRGGFAERTGSSHFNAFTETLRLLPLNLQAFQAMWEDCLKQSSERAREKVSQNFIDMKSVHALCGGIPAYGKLLGEHWALGCEGDFPGQLKKWFKEIFDRQSPKGQAILRAIADDRPLVNSSHEEEDKLRHANLIADNDPDVGGYHLHGGLWTRYMEGICHDDPDETVTIKHAGDLAKLIIKNNKLAELLQWAGKNEHDWLEYKRIIIPEGKWKQKAEEERKTKGDFIWHVLESVVAMANTRGGCVLIGVHDDGTILGVDQAALNEKGEEAFIRDHIESHLTKKKFTLSSKKSSKTVDTRMCYFGKPYVAIEVVGVREKHIVALIISPNKDKLWETEEEENGERKAYVLCRSSNCAQNQKLYGITDCTEHQKNRFEWFTDGLMEIWNKIKTDSARIL
jgi:hypothetical protein